MKTILFLATFSLLLPACQEPARPVKERPVQIDTMQLVAPPAPLVKVASNEVYVVSRDSTTYIRFGDCYFSLDWITADPRRNDFEMHPDTLYFNLAHLRTIEGQMLAVTTGEAEKIRVFQCYETSAIIEKKPLLQWKHYRSPWETLIPEASNFFLCKKYTQAERTRFPPTSIHALQQHVKQHGSPAAYASVAQLDTFPSPSANVNISRYYIRLDGGDKKTADKINKLLIIDVNFNG
ncbi:hypothetical protein [Chitinophaga arvensicola]|uniref:Uncharacterized protein n=1 Tax=Chitinophaga arvensicola TaxID=29529 RepID=A0A1I0P4Y8_9BACT|nr:hypothetical protein [Chitinophaga arvensicola]SEW09425.1 hypothetical protein SAMN04488122_0566 [Chitinophaga arvensicola]